MQEETSSIQRKAYEPGKTTFMLHKVPTNRPLSRRRWYRPDHVDAAKT